MEKVRPWCGQRSDRGWLKNRTAPHAMQAGSAGKQDLMVMGLFFKAWRIFQIATWRNYEG